MDNIIKTLLLFFVSAVSLIGCGSPPSAPPELPPPVIWTGELQISARLTIGSSSFLLGGGLSGGIKDLPPLLLKGGIKGGLAQEINDDAFSYRTSNDTIYTPDSIGVKLDGQDLGLFANPCTISDLTEGPHTVGVSAFYNYITYSAPIQAVQIRHTQPTLLNLSLTRADLRGWIWVRGQSEAGIIDSLRVRVDGVDYGLGPNPRLLDNLPQGPHKLSVSRFTPNVMLESNPHNIVVQENDTTEVFIDLFEVAPQEGSRTPDIYGIDIDGNPRILSDYWGEVIYLYFFEHT